MSVRLLWMNKSEAVKEAFMDYAITSAAFSPSKAFHKVFSNVCADSNRFYGCVVLGLVSTELLACGGEDQQLP